MSPFSAPQTMSHLAQADSSQDESSLEKLAGAAGMESSDASGGSEHAAGSQAGTLADESERVKPEPISFEEGVDLMLDKIFGWYRLLLEMLPNFVIALLALALFWFFGSLVQQFISKVLAKKIQTGTGARMLASTVKLFFILLGLFIAFKIMGLSAAVASLLAGVGIFGIAIGFALQDILENYIIGLLMSVRKPFEVNDLIETNGTMGFVRDVNLRNTLVEDFQGQMVIIPNKLVYQNKIENYSYTGYRKIKYEIGISYGDDPQEAADVCKEALRDMSFLDGEEAIEFYALSFGEYAINCILRVKIAYPGVDYFQARHEITVRIHRAFNDHGILIPWPIRTLDFNAKGGRGLDEAWTSKASAKHGSRGETDEVDEDADDGDNGES